MSENEKDRYVFLKKRHVKYFSRCLNVLPSSASYLDTTRMSVLFFTLSGLDILGALEEIESTEKTRIINWIYSLQVVPAADGRSGGFRGGTCLSIDSADTGSPVSNFEEGHIAMTYTALATLLLLGDDLSRVNRAGILDHVKSLQCENGSFNFVESGSERDLRFVYCAAVICHILQDFSCMDVDSAFRFIMDCLSYEGGFGQSPSQECHAGPTYCALAALTLLGRLNLISDPQKEKLIRWLVRRQDSVLGGFNGRPNKCADSCYTFWVGASLSILGGLGRVDRRALVNFVLSLQDPVVGGVCKSEGIDPDGLHSYLALSGLSLLSGSDADAGLSCDLAPVDPSLNVSRRAVAHLKTLHAKTRAS